MQNYGLNQPTIIRIRGELVAAMQGTPAPAQASVYVGLAILDVEDVAAGGNPDDPFTNASHNEWMYYRGIYLFEGTPPLERNVLGAVARFEVDVKSRRRLQSGESLAMVVSNPPIDTPGSIGVALVARVLFHEFGR